MTWLRLMTCAPERQSAGDILFLGGGGVVRAFVSSATSAAARQSQTDDTGLGTAHAGTHWGWAISSERNGAQPAAQRTSAPVPSVLRHFTAESGAKHSISVSDSALHNRVGSDHRLDTWSATATTAATSATVATAAHITTPDIHCLRAPRETLRQMKWVAAELGRSESEVWAEAAHEWLARREGAIYLLDDEPCVRLSGSRAVEDDRDDEPPPAAPAALPLPLRPHRSWTAIDALLADLRATGDPSVA